MTRHSHRLLAAVISLAFVLQGCIDVTTTTKVNPDGSLTRTVRINGDSTGVMNVARMLSIDSTWRARWDRKDNAWNVTWLRTFANDEKMTAAMPTKKGEALGVRAKVTKEFLWFFTSYRYDETWLKYNPFDTIPITDYLGSWEIAQFYRHEVEKKPYATKGDSLAVESAGPRFEEWQSRNLFEAYFAAFLGGVQTLKDRSLTAEFVRGKKDTLYRAAGPWLKMNNIDTVAVFFRRILKSAAVPKAIGANGAGFALIRKRMSFMYDFQGGSWEARIAMPGLITSTNAVGIEGATAIWKDFRSFSYIDDFDLWAESRVINWWAIILTGVIVIGIVGFYLFAAFRRR